MGCTPAMLGCDNLPVNSLRCYKGAPRLEGRIVHAQSESRASQRSSRSGDPEGLVRPQGDLRSLRRARPGAGAAHSSDSLRGRGGGSRDVPRGVEARPRVQPSPRRNRRLGADHRPQPGDRPAASRRRCRAVQGNCHRGRQRTGAVAGSARSGGTATGPRPRRKRPQAVAARAAAGCRDGLLRGALPARDRLAHRRSARDGEDPGAARNGKAVAPAARRGSATLMTCAEFQELAWAYALEPQERAAAERHLSSEGPHQGCESALDEAYRTAAALSATVQPTRPDRRLWQSIERRLQPAQRGARSNRQWPAWAIAAAALLLCSVAILRGLALRESLAKANRQLAQAGNVQSELKRCADELNAMRQSSDLQRSALALLELPTTRLVPLGPPAQAAAASRGSALLNLDQRMAMVLVSALEPQVGKDYELWLIRGNAKIAAGLLRPGAGGRAIAQVDPRLLTPGQPDAIAVTLEPAGGGEQPRGPIVLVGTVSKT